MTEGREVRYGLVGSGKRAADFAQLAQAIPDRFCLAGVVTRSADRGHQVEESWRVPTFRSIAELAAAVSVDFVVVSVPWAVTPVAIKELVALDMRVLAETPPAPDLAGLSDLWHAVGTGGLVQVAEQYLLMPQYAAVAELIRSGALGEVASVSISSRGLYHSVSMLRHMVGAGDSRATVYASAMTMPLATMDNSGGVSVEPAEHVTAILDFAGERRGIYDFITDHWSNPVRPPRIVVRGSLGELADDRVVRYVDSVSRTEGASLVTECSPLDGDGDGELMRISLGDEGLYLNPYQGTGLPSRHISLASLVERTGAWCRGEGQAPYPLGEACQDHLVNLAIGEAARTGGPVRTSVGPWSNESG